MLPLFRILHFIAALLNEFQKFFIGCLAECVIGRPHYFQEWRWLQLDVEQKCPWTV